MVNVPHFVVRGLRSHARLATQNLFLRKQLALDLERDVKPRRVTSATRLTLVVLARSSASFHDIPDRDVRVGVDVR